MTATRYKPARLPKLTADTHPGSWLPIVRAEAHDGFTVIICAWCQPFGEKFALSALDNISHGICEPCTIKVSHS